MDSSFRSRRRRRDGQAIVHSTRVALVDKTGAVRGFYDGAGDVVCASQGLLSDIHRLLEEK